MTPKQQREELSRAYIAAVAARAGCKLGHWSQDSGCLDVTVGTGKGFASQLAAPKLDLQLKASSKPRPVKDGRFGWSLKREHYDILRQPTQVPHLLAVLIMPEDPDEWLHQTMQELIMRRCAYWIHLLGAPALPMGTGSTTVQISEKQMFSPDALLRLLERSGRGEGIHHRLEES